MSKQYELLIDGDVLEYAASFAAQKNCYHLTLPDQEVQTFKSHDDLKIYCKLQMLDLKDLQAAGQVEKELQVLPEKTALLIARNKLQEILQQFSGGCTYKLILSGEGNFRKELAKTQEYKGNRQQEKPVHFKAVQELYRNYDMARITRGEEADDMIGYMNRPGETVVCSIDKDLIQIEGLHYDWGKSIKYRVDAEAAHLYFMKQCLSGDSTDNIPGLPGIGDVKAKAALVELPTRAQRWHAVKRMYMQWAEGDTEKAKTYLQEQASLVWIRKTPGEVWTIKDYMERYIDQGN